MTLSCRLLLPGASIDFKMDRPFCGKAVLWELITLLAREETKESYKTAGKPICCRACLMMQHKLLGMQGTSGDWGSDGDPSNISWCWHPNLLHLCYSDIRNGQCGWTKLAKCGTLTSLPNQDVELGSNATELRGIKHVTKYGAVPSRRAR